MLNFRNVTNQTEYLQILSNFLFSKCLKLLELFFAHISQDSKKKKILEIEYFSSS